ncbi:hypothetical protein LPJ57_007685 [Coemansia sp. RSA 486]|nr:hypothetical protein LPJ57_007685 [Coemansia sp. RSA 486]KAJ2231187.1 hypothetical protein IWW45_005550 [Coemansia sp. RSA 485]
MTSKNSGLRHHPQDERSISIDSVGLDSISSYGSSENRAISDASHSTVAALSQANAANPKGTCSDMAQNGDMVRCDSESSSSMEACIETMASKRDQLRKRFKEWTAAVDESAKRLRCITDNALVNQSTRLEHMLTDGKATIDKIVNEQTRIHGQLTGFVSLLVSAQKQSFANTDYSCDVGKEEGAKDPDFRDETILRPDLGQGLQKRQRLVSNMDDSIVIDD